MRVDLFPTHKPTCCLFLPCQLTVLLSTNKLLSFSRGLRRQINHLNMSERNRWQWSINIAISQLEKLLREGAVAVSGGHLALFPLWSWGPSISPPVSAPALTQPHHILFFLEQSFTVFLIRSLIVSYILLEHLLPYISRQVVTALDLKD